MTARRVALAAAGLVLAAAWALAIAALWRTSVPGDLALPELDPNRYFGTELLDEARSYEMFLRIDSLLAGVAGVAALAWFAVKGPGFIRESAAGRIGTGMMLGMLALGVVWIAQVPFGLAALWWARRHDVAGIDYVDWLVQSFLGAGGAFLFISLALLIAMALAGLWRRRWWLAAAPALLAVGLAFAVVQPFLIPQLEPLRDPELARAADELAAREGVEDTDVRVQRVHEFTDAPNAEAVGIGPTRRVILWDTLLGSFSDGQVRVVLAHEFAHHAREHIWKQLAFTALLLVAIGFVAERATRSRGGIYEPAAIPLAVFIVLGLLVVASPLQAAFSRHLEAEADWQALEATSDPAAAAFLFRGFTERSLLDPDPPAWSAAFDGHPATIDRIAMAEAWRARARAR